MADIAGRADIDGLVRVLESIVERVLTAADALLESLSVGPRPTSWFPWGWPPGWWRRKTVRRWRLCPQRAPYGIRPNRTWGNSPVISWTYYHSCPGEGALGKRSHIDRP